LMGRFFRLEWDLESDFMADMGGAGGIGDLIGTTTTRFTTTTGITRTVPCFITAMLITAAGWRAELLRRVLGRWARVKLGRGKRDLGILGLAVSRVLRRSLSAEIGVRLEDMHRAEIVAHGPALLAEWSAAVRRAAIPHAEAPASAVAAEDFMAAVEGVRAVVVADVANWSLALFIRDREIWKWGVEICGVWIWERAGLIAAIFLS
jgi:hypothetical protein